MRYITNPRLKALARRANATLEMQGLIPGLLETQAAANALLDLRETVSELALDWDFDGRPTPELATKILAALASGELPREIIPEVWARMWPRQ